MKIGGEHHRSIRFDREAGAAFVLDQTRLPHETVWIALANVDAAAEAIRTMRVRGAPLIGAVAAYGLALALRERADDATVLRACEQLQATRPTAINLHWALDRVQAAVMSRPETERFTAALREAGRLCDEDAACCHAIGEHGLTVLREHWERIQTNADTLHVLTHCNAGWLATVDQGTALAPIYQAHDAGLPVHVWVDETRPRHQGALTAWELAQHGVPHTVITDNAGGALMQRGRVHLCLVGTDRTTARGDVCNKIGTYLKALAARDNGVPFFVALPASTVDWDCDDGAAIPIEERHATEVTHVTGRNPDGQSATVRLYPEGTRAANPAFDVTPARLVSGLITEHGVFNAGPDGLAQLRRCLTHASERAVS